MVPLNIFSPPPPLEITNKSFSIQKKKTGSETQTFLYLHEVSFNCWISFHNLPGALMRWKLEPRLERESARFDKPFDVFACNNFGIATFKGTESWQPEKGGEECSSVTKKQPLIQGTGFFMRGKNMNFLSFPHPENKTQLIARYTGCSRSKPAIVWAQNSRNALHMKVIRLSSECTNQKYVPVGGVLTWKSDQVGERVLKKENCFIASEALLGHQKNLKDAFFFFFFSLNLSCEFYCFFEILVLAISSTFSYLPSEVPSERTPVRLILQTPEMTAQNFWKCL